MNPENQEILTESLKDKEAEPASRYFDTGDVEYVLMKYIDLDGKSEEEKEDAMARSDMLTEWLGDQGKIVSLEELDDSNIIAKVVPAELVDEAENKILATSDPIKDKVKDIDSDIERLLDDLENEELYIETGWVTYQLREFLYDLKRYAPKTPAEYFELKDDFIYDHVTHI